MDRIINDRYKLLEVVGEGGMNTVYKAEDLKTGDMVAIKILKNEFGGDEDVIRRFHLESEAIQKIEHDNIVKVLDVGVDGNEHFLVMELLKSQTLKDFISETDKFFNNEDIISMSLQILRGIRAAHEKEIVHRDIKPQNILIDSEGNLKVSDFGIARVASSNTMKNTKDAIGSVHYASPEQSRGSVVDKRSDIYSFGILLYELSTGRLPFEGETAISIAIKHTRGGMVNPCYLNLNLNPSIASIINKCVQREPSQRFESVDQIIGLFEALEKDPNQELGSEYQELVVIPTDTIDMNGIAPFLEGDDKEEKNKVAVTVEKQKFNVVPMIITVLAAIVLAAMILFLTFWDGFRKTEAIKPFKLDDVVGKNFTEASELLTSKKLNVEKTDAKYDDKIEKNSIISQIPEAESVVKEGQTVKVVVSLGKKEITMPDIMGKTMEEARVLVHNSNLEVKIEKDFSDKERGLVIAQEPKAGEVVEDGEIVSMTISIGDKAGSHLMPSLYAKHRNEAVDVISELKFVVGVIESEYNDSVAEGGVTWQSISPGSEVSEGTVVNLKLSLGPKPKTDGPGMDENSNKNIDENPNAEDKKDGEDKNDKKDEDEDNTNPSSDTQNSKEFYVPLKQDKEEYAVKVVKVVDGKEEVLYDKVHPSSDGSVRVDVVGKGNMTLKFYIDGKLIDEKTVDL